MARDLSLERCEAVWSLSSVFKNKKTFILVRKDQKKQINDKSIVILISN